MIHQHQHSQHHALLQTLACIARSWSSRVSAIITSTSCRTISHLSIPTFYFKRVEPVFLFLLLSKAGRELTLSICPWRRWTGSLRSFFLLLHNNIWAWNFCHVKEGCTTLKKTYNKIQLFTKPGKAYNSRDNAILKDIKTSTQTAGWECTDKVLKRQTTLK